VRPAIALFALLACGAVAWLFVRDNPAERGMAVPLNAVLDDGGQSGFAQALERRDFQFPRDHGPHPEFRSEWWYFTGNVHAESGEELGFQLTFFRFAIAPQATASESRWRQHQVFMAHFAVTDVAPAAFASFERFGRPALGLAGVGTNPLRVWLEDWSVALDNAGRWRLLAQEDGYGIDLVMEPLKPPIPQGENGLSPKSAAPGNASYYYSESRLATRGQIRTPRGTFTVQGLAWLDREWSTSALGPDQSGWDWFALQFDDGNELMLYQLRRHDGSVDPMSAGNLMGSAGSASALRADDFSVAVIEHWRSRDTGVTYPSGWRIRIPKQDIELHVSPRVRGQELNHAFRYWEGMVKVTGRAGRRNVTGSGYVELTGY
jgi:predicted secreted hydrolase